MTKIVLQVSPWPLIEESAEETHDDQRGTRRTRRAKRLCVFSGFCVDRCLAQSTKDRAEEGFETVEMRLRAEVAARIDERFGQP